MFFKVFCYYIIAHVGSEVIEIVCFPFQNIVIYALLIMHNGYYLLGRGGYDNFQAW